MSSRLPRWIALIAVLTLTVACGTRKETPKVPLSAARADSAARAEQLAHSLLGPAAKAALDSGNTLFRQKAYLSALNQYRLASERAPQHSAPLFGIYMVGKATNNQALADSALAGIRARNGDLPAAPHAMSDSALKTLHNQLKKKASTG